MQRDNFDHGWLFHLGDAPGASSPGFDDSSWRVLDLPHDYSIELPRDPRSPGGAANGFFPAGAGWYRRRFELPPEARDGKVLLEFEGVYMNAEAWCNGHNLGRHPYGYTGFHYDLTPHLVFGGENTVAVRVDNSQQPNTRWYSGSGIYRHAWLMTSGPVHITPWGLRVETPEVSGEAALVRIGVTVANETGETHSLTVRCRLLAPGGAEAGAAVAELRLEAGASSEATCEAEIAAPLLWSTDAPRLYEAEAEILESGRVLDAARAAFGIRSIRFTAEEGFVLNGRAMKLRGGCVHHDCGPLGAASYDRAEERKVELLKASGYNAVRCAHNPPAPAFLDACDRLGMLAVDEAFDCWREGKNPHDYHVGFDDWWRRDIESMVRRDRNHPSVILWSIGNELCERGLPEGAGIAKTLADHVRALDPARPVTAAIQRVEEDDWAVLDGLFGALDVCGYNYQFRSYRPDHERHPRRVMIGTETVPKECFENQAEVDALDCVAGDFVWTALDYLGEAGLGRVHFEDGRASFFGAFPWHQANCGDLDLCGWKRPQSFYRDIVWGRGEKLYIAVHAPVPAGVTPATTYWGWPDVRPCWTWPGWEGRPITIDVYSACGEVELIQDGRSLGRKPAGKTEKYIASFEAIYEPGTLKAIGRCRDGREEVRELATAGDPARIRLVPDCGSIEASRGNLAFVTVEAVDGEGRVNPNANGEVAFAVWGAGSIAAVGSPDPVSTESYRGGRRRLYRGRCLAVVASDGRPGEIRLAARAEGLAPAEIVIEAVQNCD